MDSSAFLDRQYSQASTSNVQMCDDIIQVVLKVIEIADVTGSVDKALSSLADELLSYYKGFFFSAYLCASDNVTKCLHYDVLVCRGFPITRKKFEELINENLMFATPLETMKAPYFTDDFQQEQNTLRGNLFEEKSVAMIPIVSRSEVIGWYTLSSVDAGFQWSEVEKIMLVAIGRAAGVVVHQKSQYSDLQQTQSKTTNLTEELRGAISSVLEDSLLAAHGAMSAEESEESEQARLLAASLSPKEREVLLEVVEGRSNDEISKALFVSVSTVKKHVENILFKLHLHNRVQAAVFVEKYSLHSILKHE